ncbi:MAG TPA: membrane protein insertion efficiency factor YidD [Candidatus Omnitrophica bacterium]|nr:membrane protein insertion efficiency factor YidD [Candidatus Omnitrophota bacterium]
MQRLILKLLLIYKRFISPLFPPRCRFYPSCSEYAYMAVSRKGVIRGILYTVIRIAKCHPFHPGGYNPVR